MRTVLPALIDIWDVECVRQCCSEFGCSEEELRAAIEAVGAETQRVRAAMMFLSYRSSRDASVDRKAVLQSLGCPGRGKSQIVVPRRARERAAHCATPA